MDCPKCQAEMLKVHHEGIEVDRCSQCGGIWFDLLEHEHLREMKGSEVIDSGDPKVGESMNEVAKIDCPVCKTQLIRMVDRRQPHIWYESCTVCHGLYFDAGEFKDYKSETVLDFFRDLFAKERK